MLFLLYREKFILKRFIPKKKFFFKGLYWRIYLWLVIDIKVFHHFKKERVERKQRNKINNFPSKLKDTFPRIPPVDWQGHLVSRDSSKISIWFFQYVYIYGESQGEERREQLLIIIKHCLSCLVQRVKEITFYLELLNLQNLRELPKRQLCYTRRIWQDGWIFCQVSERPKLL